MHQIYRYILVNLDLELLVANFKKLLQSIGQNSDLKLIIFLLNSFLHPIQSKWNSFLRKIR